MLGISNIKNKYTTVNLKKLWMIFFSPIQFHVYLNKNIILLDE